MNKKHYKVPRGQFEEEQIREEKHDQNLKALLIILPIVMVAVLLVGLFFGYKSYLKDAVLYTGSTASDAYLETVAEENDMILRVVNSASPLDPSYVPALSEVKGISVASDAAESLEELLAAAEKDGVVLWLESGYISFEEQNELFESAMTEYKNKAKVSTVRAESYIRKKIPKAGESEQQTGLVVYITTEGNIRFDDTPAFSWMLKNAPDFGFVLRYPEVENAGGMSFTPYLFRYVGKENAFFMRAYNMNFDEYAEYMTYH
ncbi:MAG: M15 family metallopeptidase [Ruminococcus sp.]|nr:M15 family metallopeptidase [Ruminococcus sp.]